MLIFIINVKIGYSIFYILIYLYYELVHNFGQYPWAKLNISKHHVMSFSRWRSIFPSLTIFTTIALPLLMILFETLDLYLLIPLCSNEHIVKIRYNLIQFFWIYSMNLLRILFSCSTGVTNCTFLHPLLEYDTSTIIVSHVIEHV